MAGEPLYYVAYNGDALSTFYMQAAVDNIDFSSPLAVYSYAEKSLEFQYGDVTFEKFCTHYNDADWIGRKVVAIPLALWVGVVKTIYHLALLIFNPVGRSYSIVRSLQEGVGRVVSLFDDRYGLYLIESSRFHLSCYDANLEGDAWHGHDCLQIICALFLNTWFGNSIPYYFKEGEGQETLWDFVGKSKADQLAMIKHYHLGNSAELLLELAEQQGIDERILKVFVIKDLAAVKLLHIGFLQEDKWGELKLSDIIESSKKGYYSVITVMPSIHRLQEELFGSQSRIDQLEDIDSLTLREVALLSPDYIRKNQNELSDAYFYFLNDSQIQALDLSNLKKSAFLSLFGCHSDNGNGWVSDNRSETERRIALFDKDLLFKIILDGSLFQIFRFLGEEDVNRVRLDQIRLASQGNNTHWPMAIFLLYYKELIIKKFEDLDDEQFVCSINLFFDEISDEAVDHFTKQYSMKFVADMINKRSSLDKDALLPWAKMNRPQWRDKLMA